MTALPRHSLRTGRRQKTDPTAAKAWCIQKLAKPEIEPPSGAKRQPDGSIRFPDGSTARQLAGGLWYGR